jgi:hypothetical protein
MNQGLFLKVYTCSAGQEIPRFCETQGCSQKSVIGPYNESYEFSQPHTVSL